jgi:hypothetical protein
MHMTYNLGRARHSVRAAPCQSTRSAGKGLPALPAVLAPVAAGQFCPNVCYVHNPEKYPIVKLGRGVADFNFTFFANSTARMRRFRQKHGQKMLKMFLSWLCNEQSETVCGWDEQLAIFQIYEPTFIHV